MRVTLVAHTPNPLQVAGRAANTCYSHDGKELTDDRYKTIIEHCIRSGHMSVLEHVSFTFEIEGVSRALSHQLVRHRIASYSQQSQRYVKMDKPTYVMPPSIRNEHGRYADRAELYDRAMGIAWEIYNVLIEKGVPAEDARMVLPNACTTRITVTMNVRALFNFFAHRLCNRAQWEIRAMAMEMYKECVRVFPEAFQYAGPPCMTDHCHEAIPCGEPVEFGPKTIRRGGQ